MLPLSEVRVGERMGPWAADLCCLNYTQSYIRSPQYIVIINDNYAIIIQYYTYAYYNAVFTYTYIYVLRVSAGI